MLFQNLNHYQQEFHNIRLNVIDCTKHKVDSYFEKLDLTDEKNIKYLFDKYKPDLVINSFGIKGSPLKAKNQPVDFLYPSLKINTEIINQSYRLFKRR